MECVPHPAAKGLAEAEDVGGRCPSKYITILLITYVIIIIIILYIQYIIIIIIIYLTPPPKALPRQRMSGATPQCS